MQGHTDFLACPEFGDFTKCLIYPVLTQNRTLKRQSLPEYLPHSYDSVDLLKWFMWYARE